MNTHCGIVAYVVSRSQECVGSLSSFVLLWYLDLKQHFTDIEIMSEVKLDDLTIHIKILLINT